jgi:hypothetical protein
MHPHDIFLQLLLAWGLAGLLLASIVGFGAARRIIGQTNEQTFPLCAAACILAAYSLIDGALYNVHPVAIFAACIGITLGDGRVAIITANSLAGSRQSAATRSNR